jgi:hypothetical protein
MLGHATIRIHSNKVQGRVDTALNGRQINVKGQLVT